MEQNVFILSKNGFICCKTDQASSRRMSCCLGCSPGEGVPADMQPSSDHLPTQGLCRARSCTSASKGRGPRHAAQKQRLSGVLLALRFRTKSDILWHATCHVWLPKSQVIKSHFSPIVSEVPKYQILQVSKQSSDDSSYDKLFVNCTFSWSIGSLG